MFYKCKKCGKVWQHPIRKCPYCFSSLQRVFSNKAKVIGLSKTTIPTLLHPRVPYFVLLLEDENKNRWVQKSVKEYKIGDFVEYEKSNSKEDVALWRIKYDVLETLEKLDSLIGFKIKKRVLIIPTAVSAKQDYLGDNISVKHLSLLIDFLKKKGAEKIKIGFQSFNDIPADFLAQKLGIVSLCREKQADFLNLALRDFKKEEAEGLTFQISEEVFKNDLIVNFSLMKMDKKGIVGAGENIFNVLNKESYLSLKYLYQSQKILKYLNKIIPQYLNIGMAENVLKPNKFTVPLNLMLASMNAVNLDKVFSKIVNMEDDIGNIKVFGRDIREVEYMPSKFC